MTKIFNLYEAKNQLSSLVDRAASGEEIVIAKHGQPMAKLVAGQGRQESAAQTVWICWALPTWRTTSMRRCRRNC